MINIFLSNHNSVKINKFLSYIKNTIFMIANESNLFQQSFLQNL